MARGFGSALARRAVVALAMAAGLAAALQLPLLSVAANRLVPGTPVGTVAALGSGASWFFAATILGIYFLVPGRRTSGLAALVLLAAALLALPVCLGAQAPGLTVGMPPAARVRLASGAWIATLVLAVALAVACRQVRLRGLGWLTLLGLLAALVLLGWEGAFDGLSLAVEYHARRDAVVAAFGQHVVLSGAALVLAVLVATGLSALPRGRGLADLAVSGIQVVPAVALLGALVVLASGLLTAFPGLRGWGLSALGPGPAILAVAAYLLLPLRRGIDAALRAPDPETIDAATAIGLTPAQILARVRLPLGAPLLAGALRVAAVQSVGLATLGALVGAGGLGRIVFDGMAQFAPDLILLGALPVIALSLAAEGGLSLAEAHLRRRWHG